MRWIAEKNVFHCKAPASFSNECGESREIFYFRPNSAEFLQKATPVHGFEPLTSCMSTTSYSIVSSVTYIFDISFEFESNLINFMDNICVEILENSRYLAVKKNQNNQHEAMKNKNSPLETSNLKKFYRKCLQRHFLPLNLRRICDFLWFFFSKLSPVNFLSGKTAQKVLHILGFPYIGDSDNAF